MGNADQDRTRLLQSDQIDYITKGIRHGPWLTVYSYAKNGLDSQACFSALIPKAKAKRVLSDVAWDFSIGDGSPGVITHFKDGQPIDRYNRFGNDSGIEPLVLKRDFHGIRPGYVEIAEEFRLFHNLFHDIANQKYIEIDDNGDEHDAVIYDDLSMRVRLSKIKDFLTTKGVLLALYIDSIRRSPYTLSDLGITEVCQDIRRDHFHLELSIRPISAGFTADDRQTLSRLIGKRLIWGSVKSLADPKDALYQDFIIDTGDDGLPMTYTSNPDKLANYFGANPGAPHHLTPVFFRREALNKYYANPSKYSVEDSLIRCGNLWSLHIDNNHDKYVVVFLGDLGRDLSAPERVYWRSFNVPPEGTISEVSFKRNFLVQFTAPTQKDLIFKYRFDECQKTWESNFGWQLFKPLAQADQHYYRALHIPLTNDRAEFDDQILALAKILVDSLNESKIQDALPTKIENEKGISKLERFLKSYTDENLEPHITFLRNLYKLRHGSGHRKGDDYQKIAATYHLDDREPMNVFADILQQAIAFMDFLQQFVAPKS